MTAVRADEGFTEADHDETPEDDGRRYELLNGALIVSPTPLFVHQVAVGQLHLLLHAAVVPPLRAIVSPLDVYLSTGDILEPDVLVLDPAIVVDGKVRGAPVLAVEVLSRSSRRRDVGEKLEAYRDAGVEHYWVVDPISPRLQVWRLAEDEYVEVADVAGDEGWTAEAPFPVTIRPADLVV